MEYRKSLIGAASILALSVGMNQGANASVPQPLSEAKVPLARDITSAALSDPLLDLIVRTQGTFTEETVQSALRSMYAEPAQTDIERIPELLSNIATLGIAPNVFQLSKQTLVDIVASAQADEVVKADVVAQLENGAGLIQLAQSQEEILRRRGRRDPNEIGQVGRDPNVIGQVPGNPGGGY
jgi:hypothetical protein